MWSILRLSRHLKLFVTFLGMLLSRFCGVLADTVLLVDQCHWGVCLIYKNVWQCLSSDIHMKSKMQGFRNSIIVRCSMSFTFTISGCNAVADWCIIWDLYTKLLFQRGFVLGFRFAYINDHSLGTWTLCSCLPSNHRRDSILLDMFYIILIPTTKSFV